MTTSIVEKLRINASAAPLWADIMNAAADEIERLQEDNNKLRGRMHDQWMNQKKIKDEAVLTYLSSAEIPANAKGRMIGEFSTSYTQACPECFHGDLDEECEVCGGEVYCQVRIDVPWSVQKNIFKAFIECAKDEHANKLEKGEL